MEQLRPTHHGIAGTHTVELTFAEAIVLRRALLNSYIPSVPAHRGALNKMQTLYDRYMETRAW